MKDNCDFFSYPNIFTEESRLLMEEVLKQILNKLDTMGKDIHELKEGQARLEGKVNHLEEGQKKLETGQEEINQQIDGIYQHLDRIEKKIDDNFDLLLSEDNSVFSSLDKRITAIELKS